MYQYIWVNFVSMTLQPIVKGVLLSKIIGIGREVSQENGYPIKK